MAKSNLTVRVLTAALLAPLLLLVMYFLDPLYWYLVVCAVACIGAHELFAMTHPGDRVSQWLGVVMTGVVSGVLYFFGNEPRAVLTLVLCVVACGALLPLWRLGEISTAAARMMAGIAGPFYVGGLMTTLALIQRAPFGPHYVLLVLSLAWFGDTAGYFVGRAFGRHKLYPAVSPAKTREGLVGAVLGSVAAGVLASAWYLPEIPLLQGVLLGLVAGTLGPLGDLAESLLKRSSGVKDSGSLIPGHGGVLDRFDAVLFVGPIVYLYAIWVTP